METQETQETTAIELLISRLSDISGAYEELSAESSVAFDLVITAYRATIEQMQQDDADKWYENYGNW